MQFQFLDGAGHWQQLNDTAPLGNSAFSSEFELAQAESHTAASGNCLPIQPLSFRDFMVYPITDRYRRGLAKLAEYTAPDAGQTHLAIAESLQDLAPDVARYIIEFPTATSIPDRA